MTIYFGILQGENNTMIPSIIKEGEIFSDELAVINRDYKIPINVKYFILGIAQSLKNASKESKIEIKSETIYVPLGSVKWLTEMKNYIVSFQGFCLDILSVGESFFENLNFTSEEVRIVHEAICVYSNNIEHPMIELGYSSGVYSKDVKEKLNIETIKSVAKSAEWTKYFLQKIAKEGK